MKRASLVVILIVAAAIAALAACSMGKEPAPAAVVPLGKITGKVTVIGIGPGRKHAAWETRTHESPADCTVHAGAGSARTGSDGTYELTVPAGHVEVSFADCSPCCDPASARGSAEVRAGSAAILDWSCECYAK